MSAEAIAIDLGVIRGIGTLVLLVSFLGLCVWAWMPAQRSRFEEAANLPLMDDDLSPTLKVGRTER